jgi:2,4-dienoyl-CoA reductase-like NADH-dependent reductase (Old Yellow Enzyme family)
MPTQPTEPPLWAIAAASEYLGQLDLLMSRHLPADTMLYVNGRIAPQRLPLAKIIAKHAPSAEAPLVVPEPVPVPQVVAAITEAESAPVIPIVPPIAIDSTVTPEQVLSVLSRGKARVNDIAKALNVEPDIIRAIIAANPDAIKIGTAGWVQSVEMEATV